MHSIPWSGLSNEVVARVRLAQKCTLSILGGGDVGSFSPGLSIFVSPWD